MVGMGQEGTLTCVVDNENMISYPSTDDEVEIPVSLFDEIFMGQGPMFLILVCFPWTRQVPAPSQALSECWLSPWQI